MPDLLPFDEALRLIGEVPAASLDTEIVPLASALGRVLAVDVTAPFDIPRFDNSAVDGYALGSLDTNRFTLTRTISAGDGAAASIGPGQAARIATGAVLPVGAAATAMQENCIVDDGIVTVDPIPSAMANCRKAGQDVVAGASCLSPGRWISPAELSMTAAFSMTEIAVRRKLRIAIASTGNELVEAGTDAGPGAISDSNRPLLKALLAAWPVEIVDLGILPDDERITRERLLAAAARVDMIITSGGVSVGLRDYVRDTIQKNGQVIFWRLAIKPGKPLLLGTLEETPVMGLPGNPVSACVTFNLTVRPLLYRLMGLEVPAPMQFPVRSGFTYRKSPALREFVRASLAKGEDGNPVAMLFRSQLSNLISSLMESDGLLDLPSGRDLVLPGEVYAFIPWSSFAPG
jgi:molybdopterin molybdotransferase